MATAIINSQMDAINESFSNISSDLTTIRPLLKNAAIGAYPTDTASGAIASFSDGAEDIPVKSLSVAIEPIQSGTGDPSPTNIRPISGHTEVNVVRAGKNLFDPQKAIADSNNSNVYIDGEWIRFITSGSARLQYAFTATGRMAFSAIVKSTDANYQTIQFDAVYSDGTSSMIASITTTDTDEHKISGVTNANKTLVRIRSGWTSSKIVYAKNIQLELGSTATDYEPYAGQTYNVALGQTVYGGTLNVTTGVLNITHRVGTTAGTESSMSGQIESGHLFRFTWFGGIAPFAGLEKSYPDGCLCNMYGRSGTSYANMASGSTDMAFAITGTAGVNLLISDSSVASIEDMTARITASPIEVYYPLATPTTVQLTPTQVSTLLGANNIFADAGEISVVYRANTELYIDKKLAQALNA